MENYPETRNDDFYLYLIYVREFEPELSNETIRRIRQKIQEEGRYPPTDPEVMRKRKKLEKIYRKVMPSI